MKQTITLLFCFIIYSNYAQTYTPFPEKTAVWDIYFQTKDPVDPMVHEYKRYTMEGDTIINSISYNKIYCSEYTLTYPPPVQVKMKKLGYCFGIRQDISKKKIYRTLIVNNTTIDTLLYDYDLKVGDTVPLSFTTPTAIPRQIVEAIDSIDFKGKKYRRFKLKMGLSNAALIEGVGNANGLIEPHYGFFEAAHILSGFCDSDYHDCKQTLALSIDEKNDDDPFQVFPNPFTEELTVVFKDASNSRELVIINMLGQEIQRLQVSSKQVSLSRGDLKSGIYFLKISDRTGTYIIKIIAK